MQYAELAAETPKLLNAMLGAGGLRPSLLHAGVLVAGAGVLCHKAVTYLVLYPVFRLLFGTLYPAYASYKAVRTKNVKEYVKWMMYWIVFALFTCIETFTDVFLSWFPFYYEIKIVLVIWLLSPATKGSSILYRKFVHPMLSSREQEIDEYITKAKEQSYRQVLDLGTKGVSALMQTAIKGGGGIVNQLKKSYSLSDLTDPGHDSGRDETDVLITDPRLVRRRRSPHRSSSSTSAIYFSEVDVRTDRIASIQSAEDISSGYSSGEGLYSGQPPKLLAREGLQRTGSLTRSRTSRVTRSTVLKKSGGSDDSDENEVFDTNIVFFNDKAKKIDKLIEEPAESSSSEAEFLDTLDTLHDYKTLGEDLNNFNTNIDGKSPLLTACLDTQQTLDVTNSSLTNSSSITPPFSGTTESKEQSEEKNLDLEDKLHILNITKDVESFTNFVQNLIEAKTERQEAANKEPSPKINNDAVIKENPDQDNVEEIKTEEPSRKSDTRGGRYNKKAAPPPPKQDPSPREQSGNPIKATLTLKPGVVKSLSPKESPCKEVFVQSPKSKRKTLVNRSPSSVSTSSSNSLRSKRSFSKLIKFPKKIGFWNKDEPSAPKTTEKRASWHCYSDESLKPLSDSKLQSKSDNDLAQNRSVDLVHGPSMRKSGSQLSIKSLTDSPLARRRLKIIRRYVDEDID